MKSRLGALSAVVTLGILLGSAGGIGSVQAAPNNMVVDWNQTMLSAFATANVPPPSGNRLGAIVQAAVFDAVNGIEGRYTPIHVAPAAPSDASPKAAVASAAHESLVKMFPAQAPSFDAALAASLQSLADDGDANAIADGVAWGKTVADQILAWRSGDHFADALPPYVFGTAPGQWQPTPGGSGPPKFRSLAITTPFGLSAPSQFRPAGPPALTSARYMQSFEEVMAFGGQVSTARTPYETQTAVFWQVDTPTAMWDRVADSLALVKHFNLMKTARLLALTNISIADTTYAVFDAKNAYNFWRPVTAIDTTVDPTWLPLLATPYFQEYPSAHSGVSSAAATVLASYFGDETSVTLTSAGLPGVERSFSSFSAAVAQVADARVFAGFHYRFSCDDAIALGEKVATYDLSRLMLPVRDQELSGHDTLRQ